MINRFANVGGVGGDCVGVGVVFVVAAVAVAATVVAVFVAVFVAVVAAAAVLTLSHLHRYQVCGHRTGSVNSHSGVTECPRKKAIFCEPKYMNIFSSVIFTLRFISWDVLRSAASGTKPVVGVLVLPAPRHVPSFLPLAEFSIPIARRFILSFSFALVFILLILHTSHRSSIPT